MALVPLQESDLAWVEDLCRGVFNGNDYMPRIAQKLMKDEKVSIWKVVMEGTGEGVGITATELRDRGETAFIFGTRISEEMRGKGLGRATLIRQTETALLCPSVLRVRFTRNSLNPATLRMALAAHLLPVLACPLIRRQGAAPITRLLHSLPPSPPFAPLHHRDPSLPESVRDLQCPLGIVIVGAWKCTQLQYLSELVPQGPLRLLVGTGGFSVWTIGNNSVQGRTDAIFVSPGAHLGAHVRAQISPDCTDLEVFCSESHLKECPDAFSENIAHYENVHVSVVQTEERSLSNN